MRLTVRFGPLFFLPLVHTFTWSRTFIIASVSECYWQKLSFIGTGPPLANQTGVVVRRVQVPIKISELRTKFFFGVAYHSFFSELRTMILGVGLRALMKRVNTNLSRALTIVQRDTRYEIGERN